MPDIEKLLEAYTCYLLSDGDCEHCQYGYSYCDKAHYSEDTWLCDSDKMLFDAVEIVRQHAPVNVTYDFDGDLVCGHCGVLLDKKYSDCPGCGRRINWFERDS